MVDAADRPGHRQNSRTPYTALISSSRLPATLGIVIRLGALLVLAAALVAVASASAASPPVVPAFVQALVQRRAATLAFVPTRSVPGYRYDRFRATPRLVVLRFRRTQPATGQPAWFTVSTRRLGRTLSGCGDGKLQTLQMGGNKVYWDGGTAWRCAAAPGGAVRIEVAGPPADPVRFSSRFAYGRVAASVKRIS